MDEKCTCAKCGAEIDALAVFPGGICVNCYAETAEANRPMTADEVSGMWGKKNVS